MLCVPFLMILKDVKIDNTADGMIVPGDPDKVYNEKVKEIFGGDTLIIIVVQSDNIFQEDVLQAVEDLTYAAENLDGVSRVVSLSTVFKIKWDKEGGYLDTDQVMASVPYDQEEIDAIRKYTQQDEMIINEVISKDGKSTAINIFIEKQPDNPGLGEYLTTEVDKNIAKIESALGDKIEMYAIGSPYLELETSRSVQKDQNTLIPLCVGTILLVLFLFFRSVLACLIPVITGAMSVILTIGLMVLLDFAINPISGIIPMLLLVIGSTEDIHLLSEYMKGLATEKDKNKAVHRMMTRSLIAICLTSLTTFIGFATIISNDLPVLREFGIATSFGIAINFIITIFVVPSILKLYKKPKLVIANEDPNAPPSAWTKFEHSVADFTINNRKPILVFCYALLFFCIVGCFKVEINSDFLAYFKKSSDVRIKFNDIHKRLSGAYSFFVMVEAPEEGGLKNPRLLADIAKLEDFLEERFDKVVGFGKLIRRINREMNDGAADAYEVPDSAELVTQYSLLIDQDTLARFVDYEFQHTNIIVRAEDGSSKYLSKVMKEMNEFIDTELSRELKIKPAGELLLIGKAADSMARGIISNLVLMLATIFIVISLLFFSMRAGMLALIPNMIPIIVMFGAMGWFGFYLSIGTFSVAVIALGIAVDDTIHFMTRYNQEMKHIQNHRDAMKASLIHEFAPVLSTSFALTIGFAVLTLSNFGIIYQFGFLSAIAMIFAFIGDIFFTPCILYNTPIISTWDFMKLTIDPKVAKESTLLKGLKNSEIKKLVLLGLLKEHPAGAHIIKEGEDSQDLYLILKGSAKVVVNDKEVAQPKVGDVIGEMAFVLNEKRSADVIANEDVELMVINEKTLERVTNRYPRISSKVFRNMSQILSGRLKATTKQY